MSPRRCDSDFSPHACARMRGVAEFCETPTRLGRPPHSALPRPETQQPDFSSQLAASGRLIPRLSRGGACAVDATRVSRLKQVVNELLEDMPRIAAITPAGRNPTDGDGGFGPSDSSNQLPIAPDAEIVPASL